MIIYKINFHYSDGSIVPIEFNQGAFDLWYNSPRKSNGAIKAQILLNEPYNSDPNYMGWDELWFNFEY